MLTTILLKEALQEDFDYSATHAGKKLFQTKSVLSITVSKNEIEAMVLDVAIPYFVNFENKDDGNYIIFEGHCTCNQEVCKHQAAVLYAAIEVLKNAPSAKKQTTPSPKMPDTLEKKSTKFYRHLPMENGLQQAIAQHRPKSYRSLSWGESLEGAFISPSEIELTTTSENDYSYGKAEKKIRIMMDDGQVFVQCLSCSQTIDTLCTHQMTLLLAAKDTLVALNFHTPNSYQKIIADVAKRKNISPDIFTKYYDLKILSNGLSTIPKYENMVNQEWLQVAQNLQTNTKNKRRFFIEKEITQLENGSTQKYAFLWTDSNNNDDDSLLNISFVKGIGYKRKEGIRDANNLMEYIPSGFPKQYQDLGQQLFFYCQEENLETRFQAVKNLIENNMETLNEIYNYTFEKDRYGYTPKISDLNLIEFVPQELECKITFEIIDGFTHLTRHITHLDKPFNYKKIVCSNPVFCSTYKEAYLYPHHRFQEFMEIFPENNDTVILPTMDKVQQTDLVNQFQNHFEVSVPNDLILEEKILTNPQLQILLREAGNFVLFEPRLKYGEHSFNAFDEDSYFIDDYIFKVDNIDREYLIDFLKKAHPEFDNPIQIQDYVFLQVKELINNYWFIHFNEACEAAGIEVLGQKDLTKFKYSKHRAKTYMHIKSGIDWFDVDAGISFGNENIKTADWIRALRNKETFITLKDGSLGVLPEEWLKQASKVLAVADVEKGALKISKYRFNIIEDLFENIDDKKIIKELKAKKARLAKIDTNKKYSLPKNITATLRDYQKHGYEWLKFLDESEFGGILADDMGLGKTLQVITLLADQIKAAPSLVIVPRSLLFNWAAELDKFCPDLKYVIHHSSGRAKTMEALLPIHIIITTYHTAANDISIFKDFKFNYIILDESQAIKNPDSKRYKAMRLLQSRNRLAMTGTPIENNTFDLFSQLSFTSPGLLGGKSSFKNNFSIPIDSNGDVEAANLLRKLIHPFILRRTKEQVAKDLPEKTETIIYCEMGTAQRKLYNNLKRKIKQDLEEIVEEKGVAKSKFYMLDGLLRLRQMCNSPLLVNKDFTGVNAESVKINTLVESLTEALEQKHNALVFSQFTSLLAIVRTELDKRGIPYAYLDGSTNKRQVQVDKFMKNDNIHLFLISIKAGNTGMNLTKADYVYILDPWWNPAVETQAIDRTHRIGQKNQVFAYKLICKNSIEEKILKLQEKKKRLASDIIRTDDNILKSLKKEELMALFD